MLKNSEDEKKSSPIASFSVPPIKLTNSRRPEMAYKIGPFIEGAQASASCRVLDSSWISRIIFYTFSSTALQKINGSGGVCCCCVPSRVVVAGLACNTIISH